MMPASTWIILLAILCTGLAATALWQWRAIARLRRRLLDLTGKIAAVKRDHPALAVLARSPKDEETQLLIRHRYDLVSELLAAVVSGDTERSNAVLDSVEELVSDPAAFMRQLRLLYCALQPMMATRLQECGLTDREIEICCLYALGLNGKAIQQYTHNGRHFQHVGEIRKKLGLGEHDKNIDGYIRSLLK
jgi:hypothetical protein